MANYLYNGIELPDINEVWTDELKETHPYAFVYQTYLLGIRLVKFLILSQTKPYYDEGSTDVCVDGSHKRYTPDYSYALGEDYWSYTDDVDNIKYTIDDNNDRLIWTSDNILNADGSVYFKTTEPIPILTGGTWPVPEVYVPYVNTAKNIFDAQCGKAYSNIAVAENQNYISVHFLTDDFNLVTYDPETTIYTAQGIAFVTYDKRTDKWSAEVVDNTTTPSEGSRYLNHWVWSDVDVTWNGATVFTNQEGWYYNSVKLPNIDEVWTDEIKKIYPYAYISKNNESGIALYGSEYLAFAGSSAAVLNGDSTSYVIQGNYVVCKLDSDANTWTVIDSEKDSVIAIGPSPTGDEYFYKQIWCSESLIDSDNTLYLSASEPVHVTYVVEEDPDEPDYPDPDEPDEPDEPDKPSYDETSFKIGIALGLSGTGLPENLSIIGKDSALDSTSFVAGYKAGAEMRRLRS